MKQGLDAEKQGSGAVRQNTFAKKYTLGKHENVLGLHGQKRIVFLLEETKRGSGAVKQA